MVEGQSIMVLVGAFIAVAIMLGVGVQILGNTTFNCTTLPGNAGSHQNSSNATSWALTCINTNTQTQSSYGLLNVVLIVIAAVVILFVVKML